MCLVHDHFCEVCGEKSIRTLSERCENYDNGNGCLGHEVGTKKYTKRCNRCNPGTVFYSGKNPSVPIVAGKAAQVNRDFDYLGVSAPRPADWPCCPRDKPFKSKKAPYEKKRPLSKEMRKLGRTIKDKILSADKDAMPSGRRQMRISFPLERDQIAAMRSPPPPATALPPAPTTDDPYRRQRKRSKRSNAVHRDHRDHHNGNSGKSREPEPYMTSAPARTTDHSQFQRPANAAYYPYTYPSPDSPAYRPLEFGMKPPPTRMPPLPYNADPADLERENLYRTLNRLNRTFNARESHADYDCQVTYPAFHPATTGLAGSALPNAKHMAAEEYEPGRFDNQLTDFLNTSTERARSRRQRQQRDTYVAIAGVAGLPGFYGHDGGAKGDGSGSDGSDKARKARARAGREGQQSRPRRDADAYMTKQKLADWLGQHELQAEIVESPEREVRIEPGCDLPKPMRTEVRKYVKTPPRQSPRSAKGARRRSAHRRVAPYY